MAIIPITLLGDTLGKRQRHLNNIVNETFKNNVPFSSVQNIPEQTPIDRLFKIDLAAKYKNVDYIIENFKHDDMLYVSRAMKCLWLIQDIRYTKIINPVYLEHNLYPEMRTNAANKMKHWIEINLKHESRCKEFYQYYKKDDIDYALKFLPKCPIYFFLQEMKEIAKEKIKPQFLKLLCERSSKAAEVYLQIEKDKKIDSKVEAKDQSFYNEEYLFKLTMLLKSDPNVFFYMIETFFLSSFKRLNKQTTKYIMQHHRDRFNAKPELYTARVLDMTTLTKHLNNEEIKDLITKLARAEYIENYSCNYEVTKPLIKALDARERAEFCKKIFIDKQFGEPISEPPYLIPSNSFRKTINEFSLKDDSENYDDELICPQRNLSTKMCKLSNFPGNFKIKSVLDRLYDEYRFKSFEKTFHELRQRIPKESKTEMRQNMILVLVSKSGGRAESVEELLRYLLGNHSNEPVNFRAAVVRSLVKRACAWRLPERIWKLLLEFGRDLGLDGKPPEIECHEGLHAIILRHILIGEECLDSIWEAFFNNFTPLTEYKLNSSEKRLLHERLPAFIITSALASPNHTGIRLSQVCEALEAYNLNIESYPGFVDAVAVFSNDNLPEAKSLLLRLFRSHVGRKRLYKENFEVINTNASFINALKHDTTLLTDKKFQDLLQNIKNLHHNQFLLKLALYFGEKGGIAMRFLKVLEQNANDEPNVKLARPVALLATRNVANLPILREPTDKNQLRNYWNMMYFLQSNIHLARGHSHLDTKVNLATLANWIHTASPKALQEKMEELIMEPRHALLVLALRSPGCPSLIGKTLPIAASRRPMRVLRTTLRILKRYPQVFQDEDLQVFKNLVSTINLTKKSNQCYCELACINKIPKSFRAEYSIALYQNLSKLGYCIDPSESGPGPSYKIAVPLIVCIKNHINEIDSDIIKNIIKEFLSKELNLEMFSKFGDEKTKFYFSGYFDVNKYVEAFMGLIARYIIVGTSNSDANIRLNEVFLPFEQRVRELWDLKEMNDSSMFHLGYFLTFCQELQYTKVFLSEADYSLPALERVCLFTDDISPVINNFTINYRVRFVILFRYALKQCIKERPELFKGRTVEGNDALNFLMYTFGKCVAQDLEDLVAKYFLSIRKFYTKNLYIYLNSIFTNGMDFLESVVKALLSDESKPNAMIMGLSIYNKIFVEYESQFKNAIEQLLDTITNIKSEKVRFFLDYSELGSIMY